jgi:nucleotide-binding universal stress UspA family protein
MAGVAERIRATGLHVTFDVQPAEDAAAAIVARAGSDTNIGLVAMTTHGYGGALRWAFGSVAGKVLHAVPTPLLVVRSNGGTRLPTLEATYRTICVTLDGSPLAEQALIEAELIASATGAELVLLSVVAQGGEVAVEAGTYLERVATHLRAKKLGVRTHMAEGTPAEQIIRVSTEEKADLIVMATHGRTGFQQLWLGSIATKVVHHTNIPALLVRTHNANLDDK